LQEGAPGGSEACTLARPTSGTARVNGFDVTGERDAVRRHIGLVFQDPTLGGYLTAEQNLRLHADLYDVDPGVIPARMRQMLEMVDLWGCRDQLTVAPVRRSSIVPAKCSR
jgi:ABC-2 type transport system ATP-binding protein